MAKKRWGDTYQKIVVRPSQFNCWIKKDPDYARLQRPGQDGLSDKTAWEECKKIIEEVHNAPEKDNPIPGICNYFSGEPNPKVPWKKNILIFQTLLVFTLLSLINKSYANTDKIINISYHKLLKQINKRQTYGIQYNPSKSAAIVSTLMGMPVYINFNTKKTYTIINSWPGLVYATWLDDSIAHIQGSCGTGCAKSIIFIAPSTVISCSEHEYRIKSLNPHYPPDFQHNRPLLIDVKKGIYVCYDDADNIQIFPLPMHSTIRPPKGYYSEKAEIKHGKLFVVYENGHGKVKRISYGAI